MDIANEYKAKVFDPEALNFCLNMLEFIESSPTEVAFLRRAVLDSLVFSTSIKEASQYIATLKDIPFDKIRDGKEALLSLLHNLGDQKTNREALLLTLRHVSEKPRQFDWQGFLAVANCLTSEKSALEDFLMTVRHLLEDEQFMNWSDFFKATLVLATQKKNLDDFLMTVRHLTGNVHFNSWKEFFTSLKIQSENEKCQLGAFLTASRHCLKYFRAVESFNGVFRALAQFPEYGEAFTYGQLDSKEWLVQESIKVWGKNDWGTVFVLAGWIGVLPRFLFDAQLSTKIRSFDIDEQAAKASELLNQKEVQSDWIYKSSVANVEQLAYPSTYFVQRKDGSLCELNDMPDVVINTSCEHLADIPSWWAQIPLGTRVILQSNDGFHIGEHVRCFKTLAEFETAMNLSCIDYRGEKTLPEFNRFMLIGRK